MQKQAKEASFLGKFRTPSIPTHVSKTALQAGTKSFWQMVCPSEVRMERSRPTLARHYIGLRENRKKKKELEHTRRLSFKLNHCYAIYKEMSTWDSPGAWKELVREVFEIVCSL